jgi:hypothetical protein
MFPFLVEVGLHTYSAGPNNGYGPTAVYTPAKDSPGTAAKVYGWSETSTTETDKCDVVVTDVELFAPPEFQASPFDLVDLPDGQYEVTGAAQHSQGPFGTALGVVVKLRLGRVSLM